MPFASWSVLTVDFLVVLHLALGGVTLAALLHLVNAKWRFDIRYFSVSFFALFPLAFCLLIILLLIRSNAGLEQFRVSGGARDHRIFRDRRFIRPVHQVSGRFNAKRGAGANLS